MLWMNTLWVQYIDTIATTPESLLQKIPKADFHGSILSVVKSRNFSFVGAQGLVLKETFGTFVLLLASSRLMTIPKAGSIFSLQFKDKKILIYGSQICVDSADRIAKKFKPKPSISLNKS